jgi:hypothetical protein
MLGGCVETEDSLQTASISSSTQMPMRPGVSPGGATIAFASVEGPPPQIAAGFSDQLATAAASRAIMTTDPQSADYLVRGYLTAYPVDQGTAITVVWDVFDNKKRHTSRVDDTITVQGGAEDPWSVANAAVMASIAGKSADDLAAFLSNTPEAIAAASHPAATVAAASPDLQAQPIAAAPGDALSYR